MLFNRKTKLPLAHKRNQYGQQATAKKHCLLEDIKPILIVLRAFGLLPLYALHTSTTEPQRIVPPSQRAAIFSYFICGLMNAFTLNNAFILFSPYSNLIFLNNGNTDCIARLFEFFICMLTFSVTYWVCLTNWQRFLNLVNELLQIDDMLQQHLDTMRHKKSAFESDNFSRRFLIYITMLLLYLFLVDAVVWKYPAPVQFYIYMFHYILQNGVPAFLIIFVVSLLRITASRFRVLNHLLQVYTYKGESGMAEFLHAESFPGTASFVYKLHNRLLKVYQEINAGYSLILTIHLGYAFYTITTTLYFFFMRFMAAEFSWLVFQWVHVWLTLHIIPLCYLSKYCDEASKEANTTSLILARVYGKSKEYQNVVDKFLSASIKQEVHFTAYGFFVINNSTLFKIFSAVTTYLVILIQFKQLEDAKVEEALTV